MGICTILNWINRMIQYFGIQIERIRTNQRLILKYRQKADGWQYLIGEISLIIYYFFKKPFLKV